MKKIANLLSVILFSVVSFGCGSVQLAEVNPSELEYAEIASNEYFYKADYSELKGYKVTDVYITDVETENNSSEAVFTISSEYTAARGSEKVYATEFLNRMKETDPTWTDRLDAVRNNTKYNGHFTVYLYGKREGNAWTGYTPAKVIVHDIEGVPSQEQIDADKAEEARLKTEKEARIDAKAKSLANGYVYHGKNEAEKNCKLFANGALEAGHAYYVSGFVVKYGGSMAAIEYGDGFFFSSKSSAVLVDYASQKIKAEVVEAGMESFFGKTIEIPLTVVIAGGKGMMKTPVVLGLIEE